MKYRKKPVVVEAFQLGVDEMPIFLIKNFRATNLETADCEADFLIANGVTFREE